MRRKRIMYFHLHRISFPGMKPAGLVAQSDQKFVGVHLLPAKCVAGRILYRERGDAPKEKRYGFVSRTACIWMRCALNRQLSNDRSGNSPLK